MNQLSNWSAWAAIRNFSSSNRVARIGGRTFWVFPCSCEQLFEERKLIMEITEIGFDGDSIHGSNTANDAVSSKEDLTSRLCKALYEVKMIREGKLKAKTADELFEELL